MPRLGGNQVKIHKDQIRHYLPPIGLFPSCERGFHLGMYESIPPSAALAQVARKCPSNPTFKLFPRPPRATPMVIL